TSNRRTSTRAGQHPMKTMVFLPVALLTMSMSVAGGQSRAELSGIASLRAIIIAEMAYVGSCGHGGYAITLEDLARPERGRLGFISPDLAINGTTVSGYKMTLAKKARTGVSDVSTAAATCNGSTANPVSSFFATAEPVQPATGD